MLYFWNPDDSLDDRYLTLVILFMLFTLVTLFRSYEESLLQGRVYNRFGIFYLQQRDTGIDSVMRISDCLQGYLLMQLRFW